MSPPDQHRFFVTCPRGTEGALRRELAAMRIANKLPGFRAAWTARMGAEELRDRFKQIEFDKTTHEFRAFTRLKQIRYLSRSGQIDADFFWR